MIYGIGTDILNIARIEKLHQKYGLALPRRILHASEWADFECSQKPVHFLAKRFAAKEAFAKAVGTGIVAPVSLGNIAIRKNELGKPEFVCSPVLQTWLNERGIVAVHLSLSDESEQVLAFAVAEKSD
ncbi:MAG: holo-ACP synthase [Neisseria sp.]|nr:holo-ACP synthase [Neisseria sp.]